MQRHRLSSIPQMETGEQYPKSLVHRYTASSIHLSLVAGTCGSASHNGMSSHNHKRLVTFVKQVFWTLMRQYINSGACLRVRRIGQYTGCCLSPDSAIHGSVSLITYRCMSTILATLTQNFSRLIHLYITTRPSM